LARLKQGNTLAFDANFTARYADTRRTLRLDIDGCTQCVHVVDSADGCAADAIGHYTCGGRTADAKRNYPRLARFSDAGTADGSLVDSKRNYPRLARLTDPGSAGLFSADRSGSDSACSNSSSSDCSRSNCARAHGGTTYCGFSAGARTRIKTGCTRAVRAAAK
jgi:hypothetical protein